MAIEKTNNNRKFDLLHPCAIFNCDECGSADIKETIEGYACRTCGLVLETQKLKYNRPYNNDIVHYAKLGTTQIGSKKERLQNSNSFKLEKLNKLHSIKTNDETVFEKARIEISRIFNCLNLPEALKSLIFKRFKEGRAKLKPGTKYRAPEKLVPISIYYALKLQNVSINEKELLEVSKISKKDFNAFKLLIPLYFPHYKTRNRKKYILQKVLEVREFFGLGMAFYYQSKKILDRLWNIIKCTKDDVVAGLIASISALCSFKNKITVNAICSKLGVKMSTIQAQVKKRIFDRFRVAGFTSLVKSSELLKKIMVKLGLIETDNESALKSCTKSRENKSDVIEIKVKNLSQPLELSIFRTVVNYLKGISKKFVYRYTKVLKLRNTVLNRFNTADRRIYAFRNNNRFPTILFLKRGNSKTRLSLTNMN
ncbi:MAG: hypothetical protein ACFFAN_05425 [Promethearchaeota archaeon]